MREWKSFLLLIGLLLFAPVTAILLLDTYRVFGITNKLARDRMQSGLELRVEAVARHLEGLLELGATLVSSEPIEKALVTGNETELGRLVKSTVADMALQGSKVHSVNYELHDRMFNPVPAKLPELTGQVTLKYDNNGAFISWVGWTRDQVFMEVLSPIVIDSSERGFMRMVVDGGFLLDGLRPRSGLGQTGVVGLASLSKDAKPFQILPSEMFSGSSGKWPGIRNDDLSSMPMWGGFDAGKKDGWRRDVLADRDVFYSWSTVPVTGWVMLAAQDVDEVHQGITRVGATGLVFVYLTLLGFCVLLYRTIINQINGLHKQASEFAASAANLPQSFSYDHSFGGLKKTLKFIIDELHAKQDELTRIIARRELEIEDATAKVKVAEKELQETGRVKTLAQISRLVAHDINQPLQTITLVLENNMVDEGEWRVLLDDKSEDEIRFAVKRIVNLTNRLRDSVRGGGGFSIADVSFTKIVHECAMETDKRVSGAGAKLIVVGGPNVTVMCDDFTIHSVLKNLIENAADAFSEKRDLYIREIRVYWSVENNRLVVNVADTAGGIPARVRERIYELGFTTKAVGKGSGWGLSQSRDGVEQHGGSLVDSNYQDIGTVFTFDLPIKR